MSKSLKELKEAAKPLFKSLGVKKLFATDDEQFFILQSRANLHANGKLTVHILENEDPDSNRDENEPIGEDLTPLSVKALTENLEKEEDLTVLSNMLHNEIIGANRKTAIAAIEKRISFLTDQRKEA